MKIIQVYPYYPPHFGGAEQRIKDLSEKLAKHHSVEIFTSKIGCPNQNQLKSTKNLAIHYLTGYEIAHVPFIPMLFFRLLSIPKKSIIHVHIAQAYTPEIVWLVSKIRHIPYIAHVRLDVEKTSIWGIFLSLYKKYFLRHVLRDADKVIVLTKDYVDLINQKYGVDKRKIKIIPNGNSFPLYAQSNKNRHQKRLLFVGRLSPQKNIPLLLQSFKLIESQFPEVTLTIVGDGVEKQFIKDYVEHHHLKQKVTLKGWLLGDNLERAYHDADIFIFPTRQESFGTVFLEAMASGLPIVTTNVLGVRNVVIHNRNGLLTKQTTVDFSRAVIRLLNNPQKRKQIISNNLIDVKKYSWEKVVDQVESVYREVSHETLSN